MRFLITSHGASATAWTAAALNQHPQVYCVHGTHLGTGDAQDELNPDEIRRTQGVAGMLAKVQDIRAGAMARADASLDAVFNTVQARSTAQVCGMVHTYRLRDLPLIATYEGEAVKVFNLVRHPVDLVHSAQGLFQNLLLVDLHELQWTSRRLFEQKVTQIEQICAKYDILPGSLDVLSFFAALRALDGLHADLDATAWIKTRMEFEWCGTLRFEDVTRDPAQLLLVFDGLGVGRDPDVVAALSALPARNRHAANSAARTTAEKWAAWPEWQREAFQMSFDTLGLAPRYRDLGYDFDELDP